MESCFCGGKVMKFLLSAGLLLATCYVIKADYGTTTFSQSGMCAFDKYDGGDNNERTEIREIPTKAAAIPGSVLSEMFGNSANKIVNRLDLGANGAMHFINAAKGFTGTAFKDIAPKLAPCLGLLGVGFGFIARELTTVSPADIIKNVNKAIKEVVDETNQRFKEMQQYVDESIRKVLKKFWDADYRGQFENWNDCISMGSKDEVDTCQKNVARAVNGLKYHFMNLPKFEDDPTGPMLNEDIKILELQLPMTKKWADLHLLILGALVKMYEEEDTPQSKKLFEKYRADLLEDGNRYVAYMEWALRRIRQKRIDEQSGTPRLECGDYDDDTEAKWTYPTSRGIETSKLKCHFQMTNMRLDKCTLDAVYDCDDGDCFVCSGWICRSYPGLSTQHYYFQSDVEDEAKRIRNNYLSELKRRFDKFWEIEVGLYLPGMKEIFEAYKLEKREGEEGESNGRAEVSRKEPEDLTDEEKEINAAIEENAKERKDTEDQVLEGTNGSMSFADYFKLMEQNTKKMKKKMNKKKMNKKSKKNKKTDQ